MKKRIVLMLAIAALLLMSACGSEKTAVTQKEPPTSPKTTTAPAKYLLKPGKETGATDESTLEGILEAMKNDYAQTIKSFEERYAEINATINGDYGVYKENTQLFYDFYENIETESAALFQRTEERCKQYFILMGETVEHDYDDLDDAAEEIFDVVYDDLRDDYYDAVYDDLRDDLYDDYYEDLFDKAYDEIPYREYSIQHTAFYKAWSSLGSEVYHMWSEHGSYVYGMWSAVNSAIYQRNYDFADVIAAYEAKNSKSSVPTKQQTDKVSSDTIRADFKETMDGFVGFIEGFAEYQKAVQAAPDDMKLLAQYADYATKYEEYEEMFNEIDMDELTEAEKTYLIDTINKVDEIVEAIDG